MHARCFKCCLTPWNLCFWSECMKRVKRGQKGQRELLMWAGHFRGPLQGAQSQFIDIQGFDLRTTGMSPGLNQPYLSLLCPAWKARGSSAPCPRLHGCHGEQISLAALCHTHSGTFSLSSSLSFLSLTLYHAASPRGLPKRAFCTLTIPVVPQPSEYIYSAEGNSLWNWKSKSFLFSSSYGNWRISSLLLDLWDHFGSTNTWGLIWAIGH